MAPFIPWHNFSVWTAGLNRDFQRMFTIAVLNLVYHVIATSNVALIAYNASHRPANIIRYIPSIWTIDRIKNVCVTARDMKYNIL